MKYITMKITSIRIWVMALFITATSSCTFDYNNPNAPTEDQVLNSVDGLLNFSLGLRHRYSVGATSTLYNAVSIAGLATDELRVVNAGNADLAAIDIGGNTVTNLNNTLNGLWLNVNLLNADCDRIISKINVIGDKQTANAVQAHAHLFKALALGTMAQFWEHVPINSTSFGVNAEYATRVQALQAAVQLCDNALTLLGTDPIPAAFTSILGNAIDLRSSLNALSARYNLFLGNNQQAFDAAGRASLTVKSEFRFDAIAQNSIFRSSFATNNVHQTAPNLGLTGALLPEPGDGRVGFYIYTAPPAAGSTGYTTATGNSFSVATPGGRGFWFNDGISVPFYLPGEMILIRAEAMARLDQLPTSIVELNRVLQKSNDVFGVNANLPAYSGPPTDKNALLNEIYKSRCVELYLSGMKLEDSRRFGRPGPGATGAERNRNFYPFPFVERNNNSNTPPDPAN